MNRANLVFILAILFSCSSDDIDSDSMKKPTEEVDIQMDMNFANDLAVHLDLQTHEKDISNSASDTSFEDVADDMSRLDADMARPDMTTVATECPARDLWTQRPSQDNGIPNFDTFGACVEFVKHSGSVLQDRPNWLAFVDEKSWQIPINWVDATVISVEEDEALIKRKDSELIHRLNWRGPTLSNWLNWVDATVISVEEDEALIKRKDSELIHRLNWRGPTLSNWLIPGSSVEIKRDNEYYCTSAHIRTKSAELIAWVVDSNQPADYVINRLDLEGKGRWNAICGVESGAGEGVVYGMEISNDGDQVEISPGQTVVFGKTIMTLFEAAYHNDRVFGKRHRALISIIRVNDACAPN